MNAFTANPRLALQDRVEYLQPYLERTIVVLNGKGGVGKTTTATHLAVLMAERCAAETPEDKVLLIELDDQGNVGVYLSTRGTERDDAGAGLEASILRQADPTIIPDVRPNLDLIPCGRAFATADNDILTRVANDESTWLRLAELIARVSDQYAWIFIDCPPKSRNILRMALTAARWAIIPLDFSKFARDGMEQVANQFEVAAALNPGLELLGVLMYAFDIERTKKDGAGTGLIVRSRERTASLLKEFGIGDKMFTTYIRSGKVAIEQCQEEGKTLIDLQRTKGGLKWYEVRGGAKGTVAASSRASQMVDDFESLANEVIDRIAAAEAESYEDAEDGEVEIPTQGATENVAVSP